MQAAPQASTATQCIAGALPLQRRTSRRISNSEEAQPSPTGTPALPGDASDGLRVIIKNTFLDVDDRTPSSSISAACLDSHGARSCMARLSSEVDSEDETPRRPRVVQFFSAPAHTFNISPCTSKDDFSGSPSSSRSTSPKEEPRRIVIQLVPDTMQAPDSVGVEVSDTFIEEGSGNICVDVKVVLGTAHTSDNSLSVGQMIPVSIASEYQAEAPCASRPSMSSLSDASSGARTPDVSAETAIGDESVALAPKMRSSMVCRHWKHGWCRYENNCRFLHPSEKKGAAGSSPASEIAPLPIRNQRSSRQIGRKARSTTSGVHNTIAALLPVGIVQN